MNNTAIIWLVLAVIFGVTESLTVALISIWMAVGAVCAGIVAAIGGSLMTQIITFLISSAILLILTIPLSKKIRNKNSVSTNADRLLGAEGVVIEKIDSIDNKGQIKALGQIWSASCKEKNVEIGEKVVVVGIEGVRAIVEKI